MTPSSDRRLPTRTPPTPPSPPPTPVDLSPEERPVAAWMSVLGRPDAPSGLREQVLAAVEAPRPTAVRTGLLHGPRAWALAAAALVVVGFGLGIILRSSGGERAAGSSATGSSATRSSATGSSSGADQFLVVDDPSVSPFHGLDTFDGLASLPTVGAPSGGTSGGTSGGSERGRR